MRVTDFMEVVVVDKKGCHKMKSTKDMEEYLKRESGD